MKNIMIIGSGELGKEIVWLIEDINRRKPTYLIIGFLDDLNPVGSIIGGYHVLGETGDLMTQYEKNPFSAVIAIQEGSSRKKIANMYPGFDKWETIIHPTAVIASTTKPGKGSMVFPQTTLSINSTLGDHGLYYIHSTVGNDCSFGDFVSVMSGVSISEHVTIGDESYIASGSTIYPYINIGSKARIAAGTTLADDCGDDTEVGVKQKKAYFK